MIDVDTVLFYKYKTIVQKAQADRCYYVYVEKPSIYNLL